MPVNIFGVIEKILKAINGIIWLSFLALAAVTPLIFSTQNSELFEVPKMFFVYFFAVLIFFLTLVKFVLKEKVEIPKSLILLAFFIFITVQALSTFFSIDKFTSVFGYPSRLNGGLLSQFAYFVIFAGALINISSNQAKKILLALVISAFAVSLWGIPAHFGKDPSCLVLTGKLTSTCWIKEFDPTVRIFSTMGQPNWLAQYLVLALPLAFAFLLILKKSYVKIFFGVISISLFLAFVLTNSRAGAIGMIVSFAVLLVLLGPKFIKEKKKILAILGATFVIIALVFGTALFSRIGEIFHKKQIESPQNITEGQNSKTQTALAIGGTESGQIRLIVWQGALEVFKKWPVLGSGPETFAYSYYLFRPLTHNQTTEWNFFYNKAHNEFLNYLAGVGLVGTTAYLAFLLITLTTLFRISKKHTEDQIRICAKAAIAAIIGYHATIFFGFSTVASQLLMYLLVALVLTLAQVPQKISLEINYLGKKFAALVAFLLLLAGLFTISIPIRFYFADILITRAKDTDLPSKSIDAFNSAQTAFPFQNPFYLSDFALSLAGFLENAQEPKTIEELSQKSDNMAKLALKLAPNNFIITRRTANTYLVLSTYDKNYEDQAQTLGQKLTKLTPTDPQSYLTLAEIQIALDKNDQAITSLEKTLSLKNNIEEAKALLEQLDNKAIQ